MFIVQLCWNIRQASHYMIFNLRDTAIAHRKPTLCSVTPFAITSVNLKIGEGGGIATHHNLLNILKNVWEITSYHRKISNHIK